MLKADLMPSIFPELHVNVPTTQGIKYAGSKLKLLPHIASLLDGLGVRTVFDGFSGTTRVSQMFAQLGYQVTACDISYWSYIFGLCYLKNEKPRNYYENLIAHLNALPGIDGWFTENYGGVSEACAYTPKRPWQVHNTRKLDAIREEIDNLDLPLVEKSVALTALILAMDEVDSTLGHYVSYLKEWSPRSYKKIELKVPKLLEIAQNNEVLRDDIFNVNTAINADFAYFDPPYGSSNEKMPPSRVRYGAYYHVWTSIVLNDKPKLFGKANRRADTSDTNSCSVFEEFRKDASNTFISIKAVDRLIESTPVRYIALSYSPNGRATTEQLRAMLTKHGKLIKVISVDHKNNVMANMRWTNVWSNDTPCQNRELLFLIEKP